MGQCQSWAGINESAAECYLPLLHALDRLLAEGIRPRWTVNMTPILSVRHLASCIGFSPERLRQIEREIAADLRTHYVVFSKVDAKGKVVVAMRFEPMDERGQSHAADAERAL